MTDLTPTHTETYVYIEEIAVPFSYPVTFTRNAFDPANPVLADAVDGRMLAYVD
ncbi:3-dehydroquinate synthase, partial [bacterium]|nr:3-dehydroquinate synthase [bacterium]